MAAPKFIDIDGKRLSWRDLVQRRREQVAAAKVEQPALFELKEDRRPASRSAPPPDATASRACSH